MKFTPMLVHPWNTPSNYSAFWDVRFFIEDQFTVFIFVILGFGFALAIGRSHPIDKT